MWQLRVHGVGGPQARKMLGLESEQDLVEVLEPLGPPHQNGDPRFTPGATRFVHAVGHPEREAYEWGSLTSGSLRKALWVVFLPFTLLNVAGWAHPDTGRKGSDRPSVSIWIHVTLVHLLAGLATITYVAWLSYLFLEVVGHQWRQHLRGTENPHWVVRDLADAWIPVLAPLALVGTVVLLFAGPILRQRIEAIGSTHDPSRRIWSTTSTGLPRVSDLAFFAQLTAYTWRRSLHLVLVVAATSCALLQHWTGHQALGSSLLVILVVQGSLLPPLALAEAIGRWRSRPHPHLTHEEGGRWTAHWWLPVGAAFAATGTAISHAAFAGFAITFRNMLGKLPSPPEDVTPMGPPRAELAGTDMFAWVILLAVGLLVVSGVAVALATGRSADGPEAPTAIRLSRRARLFGALLLVAILVPSVVYAVTNGRSFLWLEPSRFWDSVKTWYAEYDSERTSVWSTFGLQLLTTLPGAIFLVLRGPYDTGVARSIGTVWDVLTFWPRRFHPFAVPPAAEQAVPDLRRRITRLVTADPHGARDLVVVAHSQGSVLAAAALASADIPGDRRPRLITFGSPLGTLYQPTWPAYIGPLLDDLQRDVALSDSAVPSTPPSSVRQWRNFWRSTDPVGADVPGLAPVEPAAFTQSQAFTDTRLTDPRVPTEEELAHLQDRPPLERPRPSTSASGHSHYLTDPVVRQAIDPGWPPER